VLVLRSNTLAEVLPVMQKPSQNQIAEVLFRTLALEVTGVGTPDSARRVVERQLDSWGVRPDARAVRDGSGLSRHDFVTPRAIVQVLDVMRRSPHFALYRDALPVAGQDGTLRNRMRMFAQGRVQAKTGTIDKVRALSGYVTTAEGELLLFSIIANNFTVPNREIDRIQDLLLERLVSLRRSAP
jgi:serine-type D-Ala-D-Ala carboxypeptidase/endopeptidase (penicillin-binding protein 4)